MEAPATNPLVSSQKSSQLQAVLHPLVLLAISDYITRHTLRNMKGPIVGALLGQHNSRETTIEHAFDCQTKEADGGYIIDELPFNARLDQMVMVHQDRHLELVGWWTVFPASGPTAGLLPVHKQIRHHNDSAVLLGFHPEHVTSHSVGGELPLTIYESYFDMDAAQVPDAEAGKDAAGDDGEALFRLRFRKVPYSVETDETEMISMNYVAEGGGSAAAAAASSKDDRPALQSIESNGKNKRRLVEALADNQNDTDNDDKKDDSNPTTTTPEEDVALALTREEQETLAALTAKSNAIKMLHSRIQLITAYLERLPPSYVSSGDLVSPPEPESMDTEESDHTAPSFAILRQIQALVGRLDLVIPSDRQAFEREVERERNDVHMLGLMNSIIQGAGEAREVGKRFHVIETAAAAAGRRGTPEYGPGLYNIASADLVL